VSESQTVVSAYLLVVCLFLWKETVRPARLQVAPGRNDIYRLGQAPSG